MCGNNNSTYIHSRPVRPLPTPDPRPYCPGTWRCPDRSRLDFIPTPTLTRSTPSPSFSLCLVGSGLDGPYTLLSTLHLPSVPLFRSRFRLEHLDGTWCRDVSLGLLEHVSTTPVDLSRSVPVSGPHPPVLVSQEVFWYFQVDLT